MPIAIKEFPQYFGVNNKLLVGGEVTYYEADSGGNLTTEKDVFTDPDYSTPASNPQILNSLGTTDDPIYLTYPYGVIVKDINGATVKTVGWIDGGSSSSASEGVSVDSINALRFLDIPTENILVNVKGYYSTGDQGGGVFVWDSTSTLTDNNGTVIAPASAPAVGRYIRQVDDYLTPLMFGALPDNSTIDCSAAFLNMAVEASSGLIQRDIYFPDGDYYIGSDVTLQGSFNVNLGFQVRFVTNSIIDSYTISFNCNKFVTSQINQMVNFTYVKLELDTTVKAEVYADWFGDKTVVNNGTLLDYIYSAVSDNNDIIINTSWDITGSNDINQGQNTIFRDDGELIAVVENESVLNIGSIENEKTNGEACITGEYSEWTFNDSEYAASIFFNDGNNTGDDELFKSLYKAITQSGTQYVTINWDSGDYTFASDVTTLPDYLEYVSNKADGGIITVHGNIPLPNIINSDVKLLSSSSLGSAVINRDVDLRCFGGIPNAGREHTATNNHNALALAIRSVCFPYNLTDDNNRKSAIDLHGAEYLFNAPCDGTVAFPKEVEIRNGKLSNADTFTGVSTGLLSSNCSLTFDNVSIDFQEFASTNVGAQIVVSTDKLTFNNCNITGANGSTSYGVISGYSVSGCNNVFDQCIINSIDPTNVLFRDNSIDGQYVFLTATTDFVVSNLQLTGNRFNTNVTKSIGGLLVSGTFAEDGHGACEITRNTFGSNDNKLSTVYKRITVFPFTTGTTDYYITIDTTELIFPKDVDEFVHSRYATTGGSDPNYRGVIGLWVGNHSITSYTNGVWTMSYNIGCDPLTPTANINVTHEYHINELEETYNPY